VSHPDALNLTIVILPDRLAVCQLAPGDISPQPDGQDPFWALVKTREERSLVCVEERIPRQARTINRGWNALQVVGPLDFSLTGILAGLSATLAQAGIPIFAISTYDTDYILVKSEDLDKAATALRRAGHVVHGSPSG
jgi:hypothetical protein